MYSFLNDYSEGAHEIVMDALLKTNREQTQGYGTDGYSESARALLKEKIKKEDIDIHFFVGGTQTNQTAIAAFLKPYQAAITAKSGHINVHETGAIEATGHKVVIARDADGKLTPDSIYEVVKEHTDEHMVQPKLVYVSNSTELGTIYKKEELAAISKCCKELGLYLFLDGARLASAFMSSENDLTLEDLAELTDAFYIGGTKNGALFGEALVICEDSLKQDFRFMIKQQGGMLAKGRLLGIQFYELFKNDLYWELAKHANDCAMKIKEALIQYGYQLVSDSVTNQLFIRMKNKQIEDWENDFLFSVTEIIDEDESVIRLVTSWATTEESVEAIINRISIGN